MSFSVRRLAVRYTITRGGVRVAEAELQPHPGDVTFLNGVARALEGYEAVRAAAEAAHSELLGDASGTGGATLTAEQAASWEAAFAELELRDKTGGRVDTEFLHLLASPRKDPPDIWVVARRRPVEDDESAA